MKDDDTETRHNSNTKDNTDNQPSRRTFLGGIGASTGLWALNSRDQNRKNSQGRPPDDGPGRGPPEGDDGFGEFAPEIRENEGGRVHAYYSNLGAYGGSPQAVGSRVVGHTFQYDDGKYSFSSKESLSTILIPPLHHPPGTIPTVIFQALVKNDTEGETTYIKADFVKQTENSTPLKVAVGNTSLTRIYKESYLADILNNNSTGVQFAFPTIEIIGSTSGGTGLIQDIVVGIQNEVR